MNTAKFLPPKTSSVLDRKRLLNSSCHGKTESWWSSMPRQGRERARLQRFLFKPIQLQHRQLCYECCERSLSRELDLEPEERTRKIYRSIIGG